MGWGIELRKTCLWMLTLLTEGEGTTWKTSPPPAGVVRIVDNLAIIHLTLSLAVAVVRPSSKRRHRENAGVVQYLHGHPRLIRIPT